MEKVYLAKFETVDVRLSEMDKAIVLRADVLDRRVALLNELRAEVIKDREMYLRRDQYDDRHKTLEIQVKFVENKHDDRIASVTERMTKVETAFYIWGGVITCISLTLQLVFHFWGTK